jgi:hypothetical protein
VEQVAGMIPGSTLFEEMRLLKLYRRLAGQIEGALNVKALVKGSVNYFLGFKFIRTQLKPVEGVRRQYRARDYFTPSGQMRRRWAGGRIEVL